MTTSGFQGFDRDSDPDNRRSSARFDVETEISLASESQFFTGLTRNLSRGGVFVATYRALPIGARITMQITLPEGVVVARGTVRWRHEGGPDSSPGVGVQFDALDEESQARVEAFCALREPLYHDQEE